MQCSPDNDPFSDCMTFFTSLWKTSLPMQLPQVATILLLRAWQTLTVNQNTQYQHSIIFYVLNLCVLYTMSYKGIPNTTELNTELNSLISTASSQMPLN